MNADDDDATAGSLPPSASMTSVISLKPLHEDVVVPISTISTADDDAAAALGLAPTEADEEDETDLPPLP